MSEKAPTIPMSPVESSNIASCGHCSETNTMALQFKHGGTYHYAGVTKGDFDAFTGAESIGRHFHTHIRGKFESRKI